MSCNPTPSIILLDTKENVNVIDSSAVSRQVPYSFVKISVAITTNCQWKRAATVTYHGPLTNGGPWAFPEKNKGAEIVTPAIQTMKFILRLIL